MERDEVIAGVNEVFSEILLDFDPSTLKGDPLLGEVSPNIDSVTFSELILGIEDQFDISVPDEAFDATTKVSDVVKFVQSKA